MYLYSMHLYSMYLYSMYLYSMYLYLVSAAEKKEREESSHPVFIVKLRNSEFIKDSAASFMIHCRGNPTPDVKIFKVLTE